MRDNLQSASLTLWCILVLLLGVAGVSPHAAVASPAAQASSQDPQRDAAQADTVGPFQKDSVGVEVGVGLLEEAWNLNASRERIADGMVSVWWTFVDRMTLVVEFHATRVFQRPVRNAFVTGIMPIVRIQVLKRQRWDLFGEIGPGFSWSDSTVPAGGTRFNYLGTAGVGVSRRLTGQTSLTTGFRWFHLSNNGRQGHDRNPDIQALGGYAAVSVGF